MTYYVVLEDMDYNNYEIRFISLDEDTAKLWYRTHDIKEKALVRYDFEGTVQKSNKCLMCNHMEGREDKEWTPV